MHSVNLRYLTNKHSNNFHFFFRSNAILLAIMTLNFITIFSTKTSRVRIVSFFPHFMDVPDFYKHLVHGHFLGCSIDTNEKLYERFCTMYNLYILKMISRRKSLIK